MLREKWSIIVPCFNEKSRIKDFYCSIQKFLQTKGLYYEIILVNDGSTDGTLELLRQLEKEPDNSAFVISVERNRGKGYAIREGFLAASGDYICTIDADGATPIDELEKVISLFANDDELDIVIGSRELKSDATIVRDSWQRRFMGRVFNFIVRRLVGLKFRDTQCGFKNYRYSSCAEIFKNLKTFGWAHDVEILLRAQELSLRIKDIPVNWRAIGESKISPLKDSIRMFNEVLKIRKEYLDEKLHK